MRFLHLLLVLLLSTAAWAQDVLPVPPLSGRVIDQTATLTAPQQAAIEAKLADFETQAGPQIVVLLVPATAPEDIASYAQRVADTWKIGRRTIGDGLLLVVAKNDRTVRIEVAKALEGAVPDLAARQVIDRAIVPAFKTGDYAGGLNAGLDQLMARLRGESLPLPQARGASPGPSGIGLEQLGIFLFIGVALIGSLLTRLFGRGFGSLLTAGAAGGLAWLFTASVLMAVGAGIAAVLLVGVFGVGTVLRGLMMMSGRGGGGLGGGGGGGFSSGGGGDFGGGGASGRW
jgi:uncharacterized protein